VETVVATFTTAIMTLALYVCFAGGFAMVKVTREDLRATQIALERMEAIRLSPYSQLTNTTLFPTNSTVYFDEAGKSTGKGGVPYTITFKTAAAPATMSPAYRANVLAVTVGVSWKSGNIQRDRSMQTYVAKSGIQGYVGSSY